MSFPPQVQEPVREALVEPEAVAALLRLRSHSSLGWSAAVS